MSDASDPGSGSIEQQNSAAANATQEKSVFESVLDFLRKTKEIALIVGFFGAMAFWVFNYFATREQLDELTCSTKVNVRMLQASSNANYTDQLIKEARSNLHDQQSLLSEAQRMGNNQNVEVVQRGIDEIQRQIVDFQQQSDLERHASKKGLDALVQNACLIKDQRDQLLSQLYSGTF